MKWKPRNSHNVYSLHLRQRSLVAPGSSDSPGSFYSWGGSFVQKLSISTYVALVEGCQRGWSIPKKIGKICRLQLQYWQYCGLTLLINIIAVPNSAKLHGFKWYQCEPDWLEVDSIGRAYKTLKQCVLCLSTLLALLLTVIPYLGW